MRGTCLFLCACALLAQQPNSGSGNLETLTERLRSAIDAGDWKQAAALSGSLKTAVIEHRDRALAKNSGEQIDRLVDALPDNTETVVVTQQPFTLSERKPTGIPDALTVSRGYVLGVLAAADDGKPLKALFGNTLRFGMLVGRKFANHPPDGSRALPLGLIAYQGCSVYAFANPIPQAALSFRLDQAVGAHQVWSASGKQYTEAKGTTPRAENYFLTLLQPDLMLACNNEDFFSSLIANWDKSSKGALRRLPEWKHFNRSAPLWGFRHFRSEAAATDPTYPSNGGLLVTKLGEATGIVFEVGAEAGSVHALWLSASGTNPSVRLTKDRQMDGAITVLALADGTSELSVNSDKAGAGVLSVFIIMAFLGFAVLV